MSVLGIETEINKEVSDFMRDTHDRLQSYNIIKNPFNGSVKELICNGKRTYIIIMDPLYPPFYLIGVIMFIVAYVLTGLSWWTLPCAFLICTGLFWTRLLPLLGAYIGLRKNKYKGKINILTNTEVIRRLCAI